MVSSLGTPPPQETKKELSLRTGVPRVTPYTTDVLYPGIANQPSPAYSFLCLSDFLSFHILNNEIFVKDSCEIVQAGVVIFGKQVDNDVLYRGIANQPSHFYSSMYLFNFLSFHTLDNESFCQRFL